MIQRLNHLLFHRHLLWEFLRRDLQARYAGSVMGFFWSIIHPLILLVLFTFVFAFIFEARLSYTGRDQMEDFALYIFCGLLPWFALQECWVRSTTCVVDNAHLIKQVRFPAKILPAYLTLSSIVNQLIGTVILLLALLIAKGALPTPVILFPLIILLEIVFLFGLGLLFSTLNTYLRDTAPLVSVASMVLMWGSPMFYEIVLIDNKVIEHPDYGWVLWLIYANPVTYLVEIHHYIFIYNSWPPMIYWMVFGAMALAIFILGYWLFTKSHREFADLL